MEIENTDIQIRLTVREAQSLLTVLSRVNSAKRTAQADLRGIPIGMRDDVEGMEYTLRNLIEFSPQKVGN